MYMTVKDIQEDYRVSKPTVYRWIKEGLPYIKIGRLTRISREEVEAFIKNKEGKQ